MRKLMVVGVALATVLLGSAAYAPTANAQDPECQTIVEIAAANPDFSTLVTAVTEAGLVETLNGDGPFTVFAPTNAAFAALPAGTLEALLADPSGALTDVLLLHVIAGEVDSAAAIAAAGTNVETLGGPVAVALDGSNLTVGGATVVTTDIEACNGIIHVIDAVITEPATVGQQPTTTTTTTTTTPSTTAPPAAAPSAAGGSSGAMPVPTAVNTGESGLAASSGGNGMLAVLLAAGALAGMGAASYALNRSRRLS